MSTNNNTTQSKNTSRHIIGLISLVIAICCGTISSAWAQPPVNGDIIPGEYIVIFKKVDPPATPTATRALAESLVISSGGQMLYVYEYAAPGFAAKLSARAVTALQGDPRIDFIEPNRVIRLDPVTASADQAKLQVPVQPQSVASWGLDRIDQRPPLLDGNYTYTLNGAGVNVYIIDTGIFTAHQDFGGRAFNGYDAFNTNFPNCPAVGHGTHVAGTVGGTQYGVAKGVNLFAVRVLDCAGSGSSATVIAGINYVSGQKQLHPDTPAVANMSLSSSVPDPTVDNAVRASIAKGITYAVAAGNDGLNPTPSMRDACNHSPARVDTAITVGATAINDKKAGFSNIGSCVSIFAPGQDITSTWNNGGSASLNGTSMAAPHVAGVAAIYLQNNKTATPAEVKSVILGRATLDVVTDKGFNSPNLLLFSLVPNTLNFSLRYQANVASLYWLNQVFSPTVAGTTGESRQMKALKIYLPSGVGITYRGHVANLGWMPWVTAGSGIAGTLAPYPGLEAVEIKLTSAPKPDCKVRYRAHVADLGWLPWVEDGQTAGTTGQARRMEAVQIVCTCP